MVNSKGLGVVGIMAGAVSIGYAVYLHMKMNKINTMMNDSIDKVSKDIQVDVSQIIVDEATNRAVDREVTRAVKNISYEVNENARKNIRGQVKVSVDAVYANIKDSVSKEVAKNVANLNIEALQNSVKSEATKVVLDKFNENLDSLLLDFNKNLNNVSKIYSSMATDMMKKSVEKE